MVRGALLTTNDSDKSTALHIAAGCKANEVTEFLTAKGTDVNAGTSTDSPPCKWHSRWRYGGNMMGTTLPTWWSLSSVMEPM